MSIEKSKTIKINKSIKDVLLRYLAFITLIMYLFYLTYLVFFSHEYGRTEIHHSYNLFPFKTIRLYLKLGFNKAAIINLLGNIVSFLPMGILLPIVTVKMARLKVIASITLLISILIELIQYISGAGAGDIDDVLLNLLGGLLGYLIFDLVKTMKSTK